MSDNQMKILIVDDELNNHRAYRKILEPLDIEIIEAHSGQDALAKAWLHDYVLILMDVQMPGMDGFEAATLILDHPKTSHIPVIFITAIAKTDTFEFKGYQSGAVDYMTKPINDNILLSKVKVFIDLYLERISCQSALEEISLLRNYLSEVVNSMSSILIGVDKNCLVTQWNAQAEKLTHISACKAIGRKLDEILPRLSSKMENIHNVIESGEECSYYKAENIVADRIYYEDISIFPIVAINSRGAVIRIDDVTEKVRLSESLLQAEKLMSVGCLAAGMAHGINNPLAVITQGLQTIQRRIDPENTKNKEVAESIGLDLEKMNQYLVERKIHSFLDGGNNAVKRAAKIVKDMLALGQKSSRKHLPSDLAKICDLVIESELTRGNFYKFNNSDLIAKEYDSAFPMIKCCSSEIEQVVRSIFRNALQAVDNVFEDGVTPLISIRLINEGNNVSLEVEDKGCGIADEVIPRIYEPFFTTKPVGAGTGLGLSVSYMIVTQNHRGTIDVQSQEGIGTRFTVRLPISND